MIKKQGTTARKHKKFIAEVVAHGDQVRAYQAAYPKASPETARKNSYKLLQDPTICDKIQTQLEAKEERIQKANLDEIERLAKGKIVSEIQLDAMLSAIAMGTHLRKRKVVAFDKITKQFHVTTLEEEPDPAEIIAATNLLYKRKGSFAEKKIRHVAGDSFIEAMKAISAQRNQRKKKGVNPSSSQLN